MSAVLTTLQQISDFIGRNAEAIIALSALGVAVYEGRSTRRHNRLSVRPHLRFASSVQNRTPQIEIILLNDGLGPALIESFRVSIDGELLNLPRAGFWVGLVNERYLNFEVVTGGGTTLRRGDSIRAGATEYICRYRTVEDDEDPALDRDLVHQELERIEIEVEYKSGYGEKRIAKFSES